MPSSAQIAQSMSPKGWVMLGGSVAVVHRLHRGRHARRLRAQLHDAGGRDRPGADGQDHEHALAAGIAYQLQNNGTARRGRAEPDRAGARRAGHRRACWLAPTQPGFSLLDSQQLGESNFQQQVTYQRALEGQLAQTIETITASPRPASTSSSPTSRTSCSPTTASRRPPRCCSRTGHARLERGAGHRGAGGLQRHGLSLDKVTITDSDGELLWPTRDRDDAGGADRRSSRPTSVRRDDGRRGRRRCSPRRSVPARRRSSSTPT